MERDTGIEPVFQAWEACVLPLDESREKREAEFPASIRFGFQILQIFFKTSRRLSKCSRLTSRSRARPNFSTVKEATIVP